MLREVWFIQKNHVLPIILLPFIALYSALDIESCGEGCLKNKQSFL